MHRQDTWCGRVPITLQAQHCVSSLTGRIPTGHEKLAGGPTWRAGVKVGSDPRQLGLLETLGAQRGAVPALLGLAL